MRKTSLLLFMSAVTAMAQNAWQQKPGFINFFNAGNAAQIEVRIAFMAEPTLAGLEALVSANGIAMNDPTVVSRYVIDRVHHQYFGYDIAAEATSVAGQYRVTISPLTWTPPKDQSPLTAVLLAKYPEPQIVNENDTIELDLLVSPDGKQKVADYIQIAKKPESLAATTKQQPKEYSLDDGPVNFAFDSDTSVWINGGKYSGSAWSETRPGATVWFYYPGQGRYILSLVPHEGFSQNGEIRDNVISFQGDGEQFEIRTMKMIVGAQGAWNLYVLHDRTFQPKEVAQVRFATDRLENLLPKR